MASDIAQTYILTAAGQTAVLSTANMGTVGVQVSGTWTGSIVAEVSIDGVDWATAQILPFGSSTVLTTLAGNGAGQINCAGSQLFRLRATALTGSATVVLIGTSTVGAIPVSITAGTTGTAVSGTAASGSTATGNPVQVGAVFNTVAPAPANGQIEPLQADASANLRSAEQFAPQAEDNTNGVYAEVIKPLAVATYCPSLFTDFGSDVTKNIKASTGNVFSLYCFNANAATRYIQLHNTATTPGGAAVPLLTFSVPPNGGSLLIDTAFFSLSGVNFSTGIAFAFSTTQGTYTAGSAGDCFITVTYK